MSPTVSVRIHSFLKILMGGTHTGEDWDPLIFAFQQEKMVHYVTRLSCYLHLKEIMRFSYYNRNKILYIV